jgi:hypothetical protein
MKTYLKKIIEETNIEFNPQRIIGWNLCKINKHIMQFPFKMDNKCFDRWPTHDTKNYHKNHLDFSRKYYSAHLGNTLLVDNTPYKTCQNFPFNVIFIESYKDVLK